MSDNVFKEIKSFMLSQKRDDTPNQIKLKSEETSFLICGLFVPKNIYDCFAIFAAGALCNAYVKKPYASKEAKHNYFFKRLICKQVEYLLKHPIEDVEVYHNKNFTVVDVAGIKFSFHMLGDPNFAQNCDVNKANAVWNKDHLRLTPYVNELYGKIRDFYEDGKLSTYNQFVFNAIENRILTVDKSARETEISKVVNEAETL